MSILAKDFYTYGPNLVILAWTGNELSDNSLPVQARITTYIHTDGRTDGRRQRQYSKAKTGLG